MNPPAVSTPETKIPSQPGGQPVLVENGTAQAGQVVNRAPIQRGKADPDIYVDLYKEEKAWPGTTLLADNHNPEKPRIIEVNMLGEVLWQYDVPYALRRYNNPGFDAERLPDKNILFILPRYGIFEVDRGGQTVWSHLDSKVSHDVDRLPNGNTLVAWGNDDRNDAQAREIDPKGETVWTWKAVDHFDRPPYSTIYADGWTHCNAVERLPNGNTLISLRNFNFVVEVEPSGKVVQPCGEGVFFDQHDPQRLPNGNILAANHAPAPPNWAVEIDTVTNKIVWSFGGSQWVPQLARDADRLPNGNTLICGTDQIIEVTRDGELVWRLRLREGIGREQAAGRGFYKAERYGP